MLRLIALCTLSLSLLAAPAFAGDDAKKEELALELMALTGSADLGKQVLDGMLAQFRAQPGLPPGLVDKIQELARPDEILALVVPLYVKTYDQKTLEAAIRFYKSPEGKKLVAAMPQLTQESMAVGQQWGTQLVEKAMAELQAGE